MANFELAKEPQEIADRLIAECDEFEFLRSMKVVAAFRDKASTACNKVTLGKCQKQNPLQSLLNGADFVLIIAQDYWQGTKDIAPLNGQQKEALIYHELCHAGAEVDEETGEEKPKIKKHDCEMFNAELEKYGPWTGDLKEVVRISKQLEMNIKPRLREVSGN